MICEKIKDFLHLQKHVLKIIMDGTNVKDILSKRVDLSNYMEFDESLKEDD